MIITRGKFVIGNYDETKNIFFKEVSKEKHLFRKNNSWAIDENIFQSRLLPDNSKIIIFDRDEKKYYYILAEDFKKNSKCFQFGNLGKQRFCPITKFSVSKIKSLSYQEKLF